MWPGGESKDVVTLVLWRHGQTTYNVERRFQGQRDVPLDEVGVRQAAEAARYLATLRPSAIFSSDLSRASVTAAALAKLTGLSVQLDKDLRERSGGSWEGLTETEIRERFPAERATWTPPDGESVLAVTERASAALERIADCVRRRLDCRRGVPWSGARDGGSAAARDSVAAAGARPVRQLPLVGAVQAAGAGGGCWRIMSASSRNLYRPGMPATMTSRFLVHWRGALAGRRGDPRGYSSVGRALAWHARGLGFESP